MFGRSGAGSLLARTPYVVKLTADPAFERARRRGLHRGSIAEFQGIRSLSTLPLRLMRDQIARHAAHIVCPSSYLRELAIGWGVPADGVDVLPNPAPDVQDVPGRDELRARWSFEGPTLVFVGRLTAQKSLPSAIAAASAAGVDLVIAGDGPDRARARAARRCARFVGPLSRAEALGLLRAADASILSSGWENFPHAVVEALAVGTPVIATAAGGVAEVVHDGENGLLVQPGDGDALAAAVAPGVLGAGPARPAAGTGCGFGRQLRSPSACTGSCCRSSSVPRETGSLRRPHALLVAALSRTPESSRRSASTSTTACWDPRLEPAPLLGASSSSRATAARARRPALLPLAAVRGRVRAAAFRPEALIAQSPYEGLGALAARVLAR